MGKKKDKDDAKRQGNFNRGLMSKFYGPGKEAQDMLDRYGVEGGRISRADMQGYDRTKNRSADDVRSDLYDAMSNDYDTRRTIEAAAMAGNKDAQDFAENGFDQDNLFKAYDLMKDLKKEYVGGGGMRGAKNEAGLTFAAVQADRNKFTEDIKGMIPEQEADSNTADNVEEKKEVVLSEHMQKAKDQVDQFENGNMDVYNSEATSAQKTGYKSPFASSAKKTFGIDEAIDVTKVNKTEDDQAQDFLKDKTNKVKNEFRFERVY